MTPARTGAQTTQVLEPRPLKSRTQTVKPLFRRVLFCEFATVHLRTSWRLPCSIHLSGCHRVQNVTLLDGCILILKINFARLGANFKIQHIKVHNYIVNHSSSNLSGFHWYSLVSIVTDKEWFGPVHRFPASNNISYNNRSASKTIQKINTQEHKKIIIIQRYSNNGNCWHFPDLRNLKELHLKNLA